MHASCKWLLAPLMAGAATAQAAELIEAPISTEHHDLRLERLASGFENPGRWPSCRMGATWSASVPDDWHWSNPAAKSST